MNEDLAEGLKDLRNEMRTGFAEQARNHAELQRTVVAAVDRLGTLERSDFERKLSDARAAGAASVLRGEATGGGGVNLSAKQISALIAAFGAMGGVALGILQAFTK